MDARVLSIQVGLPKVVAIPPELQSSRRSTKPWVSAICKEPVSGPIWLGDEGLVGDGQANRKYHGGPERALLVYAASHYPKWRAELDRPELAYGAFGENLTVSGFDESTVRIGQRFSVGEVIFQVASAREPCVSLARRFAIPDLVARVFRTQRSGWYCRVLRQGYLEAGQALHLLPEAGPSGEQKLGPTVAEELRKR